ncbi:MAG: hypothetical protein KJS66_01545 [Acidobacteria bacterium]|nr:hypothetical protein [Acidobacteriota bacterium]
MQVIRPVVPAVVVRALALRRLADRPVRFVGRPQPERARRESAEPALDAAAFLDAVDRHLRLGSSLRGAIQSTVGESHSTALVDSLRVLLLHCRTGAPLDDPEVLEDAARRSTDEAFLIRSLVAAAAGGAGASFALQRASWALRERHAIRTERRTFAAQAVFAARVLSWLPVIFGVLMSVTNSSVRSAYFGGPFGLVCVVGGVALNLVGRRWMRRITCSFD